MQAERIQKLAADMLDVGYELSEMKDDANRANVGWQLRRLAVLLFSYYPPAVPDLPPQHQVLAQMQLEALGSADSLLQPQSPL